MAFLMAAKVSPRAKVVFQEVVDRVLAVRAAAAHLAIFQAAIPF